MGMQEQGECRYIVVAGTIADGFTFTGPFTTGVDAVDWAHNEVDGDWEVVQLTAPDGEW